MDVNLKIMNVTYLTLGMFIQKAYLLVDKFM